MRPTQPSGVRRRPAFVYLLAMALCVVLRDDGFAQSTSPRLQAIRQRTFDVVWRTINEKYFDPTFGGVDWAGVRTKYAPQLTDVKDDAGFHALLSRMLSELKTSHLQIVELAKLDAQFARAEVTRGLALRNIEGQLVVTRLNERSPAAAAGLRLGFVVTHVDDAAVSDATTAEDAIAAGMGMHRLTIVDDAGMRRVVSIGYELPGSERLLSEEVLNFSRHALFESRQLNGGFGYIHFTNFIMPMKKRLADALAALHDARGLIIDLRGNSGGHSEVGLAMAELLVDKSTQLAITRTRSGDDYYYKASPDKNAYRGSVVVLLDEESASESEQVSAGLQAAGRVVVIGKTSKGADLDATFQELPMDTIALLYPAGQPRTPKGVVIEGRGVAPDIEVSLTRKELLAGRDGQLEAAISYLRDGRTP